MLKKKLLKFIIPLAAVIFLLAAAATPAYYFYTQYTKTKTLLENPTQANQEEAKALTDKLKKVMELPDEVPSVATVLDIEKIKDQPFFSKAQNGDKILIYTQAKKAILYRPSNGKVIEVAPLNLGETQSKLVKVAIYNGTQNSDLAKTLEQEMNTTLTNITVTSTAEANQDYSETVIVDLTGNKQEHAIQLAALMGAKVVDLPTEETKPEGVDFLVIVGSDYTGTLPISREALPTPTTEPTPTPEAVPTTTPQE